MTINTTETPTQLRAQSIMAHSVEHKGGTFDRLGNPVTSGVAVTVKTITTHKTGFIRPGQLAHHLTYSVGEGNYLGTWWDEENDCWEISETAVFRCREDAITVGRILGERYVYDIDADECVAVP